MEAVLRGKEDTHSASRPRDVRRRRGNITAACEGSSALSRGPSWKEHSEKRLRI